MMSPLLWCVLWATAICYGTAQQVPVVDLGLQEPQVTQTDLNDEVRELQKNVSDLWTYINELRHAMDHHLNHLHHHQVELESNVHDLMHHSHGDSPSGRSTEHGHGSHHHGDEHAEHGSHDDHHTDDHSGHGDHHGDEHGSHGDDHGGHGDHHGDDHSRHDDHHGDDHSGHGDHHGDGHSGHGDHHDDHSESGHHDHGDEHQHEQHGEQIVRAERIHHHYHHRHGSETGSHRHQDSHEEVSHSDHHESTDVQQNQEETVAPITSPSGSDTQTNESPDKPRSTDPLRILPHHHHHHHEHRQEGSQNKIAPPSFRDYRLYNFATCEVQPNRAIPEDKQQDVTGQITLWQRKSGGSLSIHVRLQGFKIGDHHGHDDDQQQQQSEDDNQLTTQISHTHGTGHRHGFHVHTVGDLSNGCQSTGTHFNPNQVNHGGPKATVRHVGDLGNIECDNNGFTNILFSDDVASLSGENSIMGRALVIHSDLDDYGLKPNDAESLLTGNAGTRIACCVIQRVGKLPMKAEKSMKSAEQYQRN